MPPLQPHPLAERLPPLSKEEYDGLAAAIIQDGLIDPITLHEGKILDGRHRYQVCLEFDIEPSFRVYDGDRPAHYVLGKIQGRGLTPAQKAIVAIGFKDEIAAENAARQGRPGLPRGAKAPHVPDDSSGMKGRHARETLSELASLTEASENNLRIVNRLTELAESGDVEAKGWLDGLFNNTVSLRGADNYSRQRKGLAPKGTRRNQTGKAAIADAASRILQVLELGGAWGLIDANITCLIRSITAAGGVTGELQEIQRDHLAETRQRLDWLEEVINGTHQSIDEELDALLRGEQG